MSNIYTLDLQKNIWYCRGLRDLAYFPWAVQLNSPNNIYSYSEISGGNTFVIITMLYTKGKCDWQGHWQLEAWHHAEFRFSSICSIFQPTLICAEATLLAVSTSFLLSWILDLNGGQYQFHNLLFEVWQNVNKTIIHHHHCFFFVKLLKEYTFLVISTFEAQRE